jgi:hypothetical protein
MTDDSRGWNPPAKEAAAEERKRQNGLIKQLLCLETEGLFTSALNVLGPMSEPEKNAALDAYRTFQKERTKLEDKQKKERRF